MPPNRRARKKRTEIVPYAAPEVLKPKKLWTQAAFGVARHARTEQGKQFDAAIEYYKVKTRVTN